MEHVSFVILHYCSIDITIQCVESIKNNIDYDNLSIIIVDNGSPDNSGNTLLEKYQGDDQIIVLLAGENIGFAKGNNIGYQYARTQFHSGYIVVTNSDTVFNQKDFIIKMQELYQKSPYEIAGPDIITPSGVHQNPHRDTPLTKKRLRKMYFIKSVFLWYFKIKQALHIGDKINILEDLFEKKDKKTQANIKYLEEKDHIVPLGACLIFSPSFVKREKSAFYPKTFMYGEEDILVFLCEKKGYRILYSPVIQVYHLNGEITRKSYKNDLKKNIFTYTYIVEGCRILLKLMRNSGKQ